MHRPCLYYRFSLLLQVILTQQARLLEASGAEGITTSGSAGSFTNCDYDAFVINLEVRLMIVFQCLTSMPDVFCYWS